MDGEEEVLSGTQKLMANKKQLSQTLSLNFKKNKGKCGIEDLTFHEKVWPQTLSIRLHGISVDYWVNDFKLIKQIFLSGDNRTYSQRKSLGNGLVTFVSSFMVLWN